jgi:hypothetical protein
LIGCSGYAFAMLAANGDNRITRPKTMPEAMPCRIDRNIGVSPMIFMARSYA